MSDPLSEERLKEAKETAKALHELDPLKSTPAQASWPNVLPAVAACVAAACSFFGAQCGAERKAEELSKELGEAKSAAVEAKNAAASANAATGSARAEASAMASSIASIDKQLNQEYHALLQQIAKPETKPADRLSLLAGLCGTPNLGERVLHSARAMAVGYATSCDSACPEKDQNCDDVCDGFKALTQQPSDWANSYSKGSGNQFDAVRGLCLESRSDILKQDEAAMAAWDANATKWNAANPSEKKTLKEYKAP